MRGLAFILCALAVLWLLTTIGRPRQPLVIDGYQTASIVCVPAIPQDASPPKGSKRKVTIA